LPALVLEENDYINVRFEILMAGEVTFTVFWDVM